MSRTSCTTNRICPAQQAPELESRGLLETGSLSYGRLPVSHFLENELRGAVLDRESIRNLIEHPPQGQPPLVEEALSLDEQLQPCGMDFSLRRVDRLTSGGWLGVEPGDRKLPDSESLDFGPDGWLFLEPGPYVVTFNEVVNMPLGLVALAFPRSTLIRSGVSLPTSVWDAGYRGRSQALLTIHNPGGYHIQKNARLMQMVFFYLARPVEQGYQGNYQGERP